MAKFLGDIDDDDDDEVYMKVPTLCEKIYDYKETLSDLATMMKLLCQDLENYVVPESVVIDREGLKPKGRCVQMKVYTLSKRQFVVVFVSFISAFVLTTLLSLAGPTIINTTRVNSSQLDHSVTMKSLATGPFAFSSPELTAFNQQIWLLANLRVINPSSATYVQSFRIQVELFTIGKDGSGSSGISNHTHKRVLTCRGSTWCDPIVVLHLGYLAYSRFRVKIAFQDLQSKSNQIQDLFFEFKTFNPVFTQVEIWFRFSFLILTFIATCAFAHVLRRYHLRNWTIEQKWMSLLLPLLLLYNDPLFPLNFVVNSWIPGLLDTIFQASYLSMLLLFWLCVYHGIRASTERRPFLSFYLPKLVVCGLLWLAAVTLGSWQQYNELLDPTYQYEVDLKNYLGMKVFFFIMGSLYLLYLGFLCVRAFTELHSKPYANIRLKFLTAITVCVVTISVVMIALRFGSSVLQDNFVAEISTKYRNSAEFVCFYALLNFYIYTMAFVYSPSKQTGEDPIFRADTGFTLLNNSDDDEDVLYGSNSEEIPLRNGYRT